MKLETTSYTESFTGILNEKQQCFSTSYWSLVTANWLIRGVLLINAVRSRLQGDRFFSVRIFKKK